MNNLNKEELSINGLDSAITDIPKYGSLKNKKVDKFRCNKATHLEKDYKSPECLMKFVKIVDNIYSIKNMQNQEFFQSSISNMSTGISSDKQLWRIEPYGDVTNGYTVQNVNNNEYMTNKASQLHGGTPGEEEIWIIQKRDIVSVDLKKSYYYSMKNQKNSEFRTSSATKLSKDMIIPKCIFKNIKFSNGNYGVQSQDNYEFFQSNISTMALKVEGEKQEWKVQPISNESTDIATIKNADNNKYMTAHASQLHSGTPGIDEQWKIDTFNCKGTSSWMGDNWDLIADKPLNKICFPGSHDSGTYHPTSLTAFGWVGNTKTQIFDIQMQLMQGVRIFDLRPALNKGEFYTHHASKVAGVLQGAIGENMEYVFAQIKAFASESSNEKELIILNFSHAIRWSDKGGKEHNLSDYQRQQFISLVESELGDLLIRREATQLTELIFSDLIGDKSRNILALFSSNEFETDSAATRRGIWNKKYYRSKGGYSNTNNLQQMISEKNDDATPSQLIRLEKSNRSLSENKDSFMFALSWQLTLSGFQSAIDSPSILSLAEEANSALYPTLIDWLNSGIINKDVYPNTINTDACWDDKTEAVKLSLEIMRCINK